MSRETRQARRAARAAARYAAANAGAGATGNYYFDGSKTPFGTQEIDLLSPSRSGAYIDRASITAKARRQYYTNTISRAIIDTATTLTIGAGLRMQAAPDWTALAAAGVPQSIDRHRWTETAERLFQRWEKSTAADYNGRHTFKDLLTLAYRALWTDGGCLAILRPAPDPVGLTVQLIPFDRLAGYTTAAPAPTNINIIRGREINAQRKNYRLPYLQRRTDGRRRRL